MDSPPYSLEQVLKVACQHPFYNRDARYPPSRTTLHGLVKELDTGSKGPDIGDFPVITKTELYVPSPTATDTTVHFITFFPRSQVVSRLIGDNSPDNGYRHNCYATITGGGFKRGTPLLWLTDSVENRHHRAAGGKLVRASGVIDPTDVVLNLHVSGHFYRCVN